MNITTPAATTTTAASELDTKLNFLNAMLDAVEPGARAGIQAQIDAVKALQPAKAACAFAIKMVKMSLTTMEKRINSQPNGVPSTIMVGVLAAESIPEKAFKDAKSFRTFQKLQTAFEAGGAKVPVRMSVTMDMLRRAENLQAPFVFFNFAVSELEVRKDQPQRRNESGVMEYLFLLEGVEIYATREDKEALATEGKNLEVVYDFFLAGNVKIEDMRTDIYGGNNPEGLAIGAVVQEDEIDENSILDQLLRRSDNIAANRERNRTQQTTLPTLDLNSTKEPEVQE